MAHILFQTKVIAQLMERSEFSIKERDEAVNTLKQVDEDNHTLRVNLHHHTLVNYFSYLAFLV